MPPWLTSRCCLDSVTSSLARKEAELVVTGVVMREASVVFCCLDRRVTRRRRDGRVRVPGSSGISAGWRQGGHILVI